MLYISVNMNELRPASFDTDGRFSSGARAEVKIGQRKRKRTFTNGHCLSKKTSSINHKLPAFIIPIIIVIIVTSIQFNVEFYL